MLGTQQNGADRYGPLRPNLQLAFQVLLQRRSTGRRATSVGQVIYHTGLVAAERPGARGVQVDRLRIRGIGRARSGNDEGISVFTRRSARAASQEVVNETTRARRGGAGASTAKVRQGRETNCRIRRRVADFGGVDRTDRAGSLRFVRRHSRAHQVRNRDRRDDQDDRHDDQQFDKRETLLLLHEISLELSNKDLARPEKPRKSA